MGDYTILLCLPRPQVKRSAYCALPGRVGDFLDKHNVFMRYLFGPTLSEHVLPPKLHTEDEGLLATPGCESDRLSPQIDGGADPGPPLWIMLVPADDEPDIGRGKVFMLDPELLLVGAFKRVEGGDVGAVVGGVVAVSVGGVEVGNRMGKVATDMLFVPFRNAH